MTHSSVKWLKSFTGLLITLWLGSIVIFFISKNVKVDKVEKQLALEGINPETAPNYNQLYEKKYYQLKENLPLFYFEILPSTHCHNKRQFAHFRDRQWIEDAQKRGLDCSGIRVSTKPIDTLALAKKSFSYPVLHWNGFHNQYHRYLTSIIKGDWGSSAKDGLPAVTKIANALKWTLSIVFFNLVLALAISVILAVIMWKKKGSILDRIFQTLLHALYSVPGFWLATLVLIFFTGPQYGMPIFYTPLYIEDGTESGLTLTFLFLGKIAPVIFCLTLQDVALLTRLIRSKLEMVFQEPFMDALVTRGTSENRLIFAHALPNAMLPLITLLFNSLPASIAGSLVFEVVFNIPGMGRLLNDSIHSGDWAVVYGICLLTLCITILLYALGDLIYRWADPRIKT